MTMTIDELLIEFPDALIKIQRVRSSIVDDAGQEIGVTEPNRTFISVKLHEHSHVVYGTSPEYAEWCKDGKTVEQGLEELIILMRSDFA